jgi:elongator complex protein 3
MTSPAECPHGVCLPCPGGVLTETPQSYTGHEPAAMRAARHSYDPYLQTKARIEQLKAIGHETEKIDLIVMGGTFTARSLWYQEWFIQRCFDAFNQTKSASLQEAQQHNETATSRCIGLTIETRPDWFRLHHIDTSLHLGATRVELGVQTISDDVLAGMQRGHTVTDTIHATQLAKESGFKVCYHLMPGLPGSSPQQDLGEFQTLFADHRFQPDMLKIYPTLVIKGTTLYEMWKQGEYTPYTTQEASNLIAHMKQYIPPWVRIQRIQRDVPSQYIDKGVKQSNLRQYVHQILHDSNQTCRCIRCREIGHQQLKGTINNEKVMPEMKMTKYRASNSDELFLSIKDTKQDIIMGYLRLRDITCSHRPELQQHPCMIIRELRVLGQELPLGQTKQEATQHKGFGKQLMNEAEQLCLNDYDRHRLYVLSGIGVRPYYRRLGFSSDGIYLHKRIN